MHGRLPASASVPYCATRRRLLDMSSKPAPHSQPLGMSFARQIQQNRSLRKTLLLAVCGPATALFLLRFCSDYVGLYGSSLKPLLEARVKGWSLICNSVPDAAIG